MHIGERTSKKALSAGELVKIEQITKMFKNKSKLITMGINPDLLELLDKTLGKDNKKGIR